MYENLTTQFFGDSSGVQVVALATLTYSKQGVVTQGSGSCSIQKKAGTYQFRSTCEEEDGRVVAVEFPLDTLTWIGHDHSPTYGRNSLGRRILLARVRFSANEAGLDWVQFAFPVVSGNARRAKLMINSLVYVDQCRREHLMLD